ncbi:hypothetical protein EVA_14299 [gut metagenome]|uniref:Uncharacterized protein n=1 Tax=gut metagenome TaxID=749906 RepID=J9FSX8_9ZZZZ
MHTRSRSRPGPAPQRRALASNRLRWARGRCQAERTR